MAWKQIPNPCKKREKIPGNPSFSTANKAEPSCSNGIIPPGAWKSQDLAPRGSAPVPKHKAKGKVTLNQSNPIFPFKDSLKTSKTPQRSWLVIQEISTENSGSHCPESIPGDGLDPRINSWDTLLHISKESAILKSWQTHLDSSHIPKFRTKLQTGMGFVDAQQI